MYLPEHFKNDDLTALHEIIRKHPLGILFTHGNGGMDANHLPFLLEKAHGKFGALHAHVARANSVWTDVSDGDEVLIVFRAADAYISPSWYPSKHETHRQVPTWNYLVVHVRGRVTIRDEERYVRSVVSRLTSEHEAKRPTPWRMSEAPRDYMQDMVRAIVGLEIEIVSIAGKCKLSQDDGARDMRGAGNELRSQGEEVISAEMLRRSEHG